MQETTPASFSLDKRTIRGKAMFQVAILFSTIREKLDVIPSFCFGLRQCKCRGRSGGVEDEGVEEGQEGGWRREGGRRERERGGKGGGGEESMRGEIRAGRRAREGNGGVERGRGGGRRREGEGGTSKY